MKKILLFFCFVGILAQLYTQVSLHKTSLHGGLNFPDFGNADFVNIDGFVAPSLIGNFERNLGYSLKFGLKLNDFTSLGLGYQQISLTNWELPDQYDYRDASMKQYSLLPMVILHSKQADKGIFNYLVFVAEFAPVIGFSVLKIQYPVFQVRPHSVREFNTINDLMWGMHGGIGIEHGLSDYVGLYGKYSLQIIWTNPIAHNDTRYFIKNLGFGLFFKLSRDKYPYN